MTRNEELIYVLVSKFTVTQLEMIYAFCKPSDVLSPAEQLAIINELLTEAIAKKKGIWI